MLLEALATLNVPIAKAFDPDAAATDPAEKLEPPDEAAPYPIAVL
tara:strand:+ start:155 stop:289 length:135 start_codon:yes stop_codon:yes gene_type:complete